MIFGKNVQKQLSLKRGKFTQFMYIPVHHNKNVCSKSKLYTVELLFKTDKIYSTFLHYHQVYSTV